MLPSQKDTFSVKGSEGYKILLPFMTIFHNFGLKIVIGGAARLV